MAFVCVGVYVWVVDELENVHDDRQQESVRRGGRFGKKPQGRVG